MKKLLFIGLAATAMLAGCSNDETVEMAQQNAIAFDGFVNKSTRATVNDDITLANLGSIEVYGWRGDVQIFDKQAVAVATDGKGTYSPLQYWEAGYTYAFEAIAPKNGEKGVTFAAAKDGGTITFVNDAETDLLYSKATDVTTPATIASQPAAVGFNFNHLLSRVKFTFVNGFPANAVAKISVNGVKISNAYKNGTITPATADAVWNATDNTLSVDFANVSATDIEAGNKEGETEHMYLIPVTSPSYEVRFTVILDQNGATSEYEHRGTITTGMELGKSYNFTATLTPENVDPENTMYPIEFTAAVGGWEDFTNNNITVK
jgi:hypothetical protein